MTEHARVLDRGGAKPRGGRDYTLLQTNPGASLCLGISSHLNHIKKSYNSSQSHNDISFVNKRVEERALDL
jgi:hypothetical protein